MVPSTLTASRGTWGTERNTGFRLDSVLCSCACSWNPPAHSRALSLLPGIRMHLAWCGFSQREQSSLMSCENAEVHM